MQVPSMGELLHAKWTRRGAEMVKIRQNSDSTEELYENIDDDELQEMINQAKRGDDGEINIG